MATPPWLYNLGVVEVGGNAVAKLLSASLTQTTQLVQTNANADLFEVFAAARKGATGTITVEMDDTDTNGQEAMTNGATVTLNWLPEGAGTGDYQYAGDFIIDSLAMEIPEGDGVVRRVFNVRQSGVAGPTIGTHT